MGRWSNKYRGWLLCGLIAVPAAVMVLPARAPAASAAMAAPARIRVVADAHYPPFLFVDADGKPEGYVADMWRLFQQHTGIQVELQPVDWAQVQPELQAGHADVVGMIYRTPSREALYDFSEPYASQPVSIYVERHIRGVHDLASLRGLPVGVERGGICADKLASLGVKDLHVYAGYQQVIDAAVHGDLRIFCMSEDVASHALYRESALGRFDMAFVLFNGELRAAVREGNGSMLATVEHGLSLITPAEREQLRKRWLEHPSYVMPYLRMVKLVSAAVLLAIALMALWVWTLRRSVARRTHALQLERDKLRTLLDASPDGLWVIDRSGVHLECNERAAQMVSHARKDLLGRTDAEVFGTEHAARVSAVDNKVMEQAQPITYALSLADATGSIRQYEIIKVPVFDQQGGVRGVLGVSRDITERLRAETQLRLWAHVFQRAGFGLVVCDARTATIIAANPVFARERGYTPEEMAGMSVDVLYPEDLVEARRVARRDINRQDHTLVETEHVARDGRRFPVLLDITIVRAEDDTVQYVVVYAQDISERKRVETELRLAAIAFDSQEPMIVFDAEGRFLRVNPAFSEQTGYAPHELIGQSVAGFRSRYPGQATLQSLLDTAREKGVWQGERWNTDKQGRYTLMRSKIAAVRDSRGEVTHFVYTAVDLTAERQARADVDRLTYFDSLTELPNRNYLLDRLQQTLGGAGVGALLMFDLDHFKRVNDLYGHGAGDRLLQLMAQRLRQLLDEQHVLCRFNGGTFALLTAMREGRDGVQSEQARACSELVRWALREPFFLGEDAPLTITVSIGWTGLESGQGTAESVLREAELAMYDAKAAGRDQLRQYEAAMHAEMAHNLELVEDLRRALAGDDLDLHYQAQVDRSGNVVGAEALVRWTRANGDAVSPAVFVPLAEQNGLMVALGHWVLRRACEQLLAWSRLPQRCHLTLSVNVSAKEFALPGFTESVQRILIETGADPARLKLEITESAILDDLADVAAKLTQLRAVGIRVSLDDFGTGYSSLAYLARLPLDQLKIDQSFVARLAVDHNDAMIAQSIIGMGRGLGLEVIAEGVENETQWNFLMDQGCDVFQGYLFAKPLPRAAFELMLAQRPAPERPADLFDDVATNQVLRTHRWDDRRNRLMGRE